MGARLRTYRISGFAGIAMPQAAESFVLGSGPSTSRAHSERTAIKRHLTAK